MKLDNVTGQYCRPDRRAPSTSPRNAAAVVREVVGALDPMEAEGVSRRLRRSRRIPDTTKVFHPGPQTSQRAPLQARQQPAIRHRGRRREDDFLRRRLGEGQDFRAGLHQGLAYLRRSLHTDSGSVDCRAEEALVASAPRYCTRHQRGQLRLPSLSVQPDRDSPRMRLRRSPEQAGARLDASWCEARRSLVRCSTLTVGVPRHLLVELDAHSLVTKNTTH